MSLLDLEPARLRELLQLPGDPAGVRIVVAMSGGVDSSVAAAIVARAGFETAGITLQLYDQGELARRKGACCAGQDIYDAKLVADRLGIAHYVLDYEMRAGRRQSRVCAAMSGSNSRTFCGPRGSWGRRRSSRATMCSG